MPLNLVVQTAFLGDLLLSIPLLKRVRKLWPEHSIGLVCRKGFGDFFLKAGLVDEVFEIQKGDRKSYQKNLSALKKYDIQHLISPHESWRTRLFCFQLRAKVKISYSDFFSNWIFDVKVSKPKDLPDPIRQLSLLSTLDLDLSKKIQSYQQTAKPYILDSNHKLEEVPEWASMNLRTQVLQSSNSYENLRNKFDLKDFDSAKAVLLFPGSVWATKRWRKEYFIELGQKLAAAGHPIYIMGGPGEEELAEEVHQRIPKSLNWAGQTQVWESAQLIARSALLVGNDSAATHLAAVCETPCITLFGPTVLEFGFRPWLNQGYVHQNEHLKCRPCGKHGHQVCPIGTHECMKSIKADDVLKTATQILSSVYSE